MNKKLKMKNSKGSFTHGLFAVHNLFVHLKEQGSEWQVWLAQTCFSFSFETQIPSEMTSGPFGSEMSVKFDFWYAVCSLLVLSVLPVVFRSFSRVHSLRILPLWKWWICTLYVHFFCVFLTHNFWTSHFQTILQETFLPEIKFCIETYMKSIFSELG